MILSRLLKYRQWSMQQLINGISFNSESITLWNSFWHIAQAVKFRQKSICPSGFATYDAETTLFALVSA